MLNIQRGDIYYANLDPVIGSEQGGDRPVLVVQNNIGNKHSHTVIVAPITSKAGKKPLPTHAPLFCRGLEKNSVALLEQLRTLDKSRFGGYIGQIKGRRMSRIEDALLVSIGINRIGGKTIE